MLGNAKDWLRRRVRAWEWADDYPILLPHVTVRENEVELIDGSRSPIPERLSGVLRACDGNRKMSEIAGEHRISAAELLACHDRNWIVFWRYSLVSEGSPWNDDRLIVVSPHPDDAALSAGGYLGWTGNARSNRPRILLLDVFTRTAWWRLSDPPDPGRVTSVRKAEESIVARMMGAELLMLDLPEALLRGYSMPDLFTAGPDERDRLVQETLTRTVDELVSRHPGAAWMLPLAVGGHVDHRIARDATLAVIRSRVSAEYIVYYEDLPYAAERAAERGALEDYSEQVPGQRLAPNVSAIHPQLRWKLELNRVYWSQFTWPRIKGLADYAERLNPGTPAERLWSVPSTRTYEFER